MADRGGMVEKRGSGYWLTHAGLIVGILFIFFPIWLAFVASTVTQPEIARPPMPLMPGDHEFELRNLPQPPIFREPEEW